MARKFLGAAAALLANWLTLGDLAPVRTLKSSAYTVQATDLNKLIVCSGTWTLALPAAASVGAGFFFYLDKSDATGVITVDPNGAETIEGLSTIALYGGESKYTVFTDGTAWYTLGRQKGWVDTVGIVSVAAGTASVSITTPITDAEIRDILFDFTDYVPSTTGVLNLAATQSSTATPVGGYSNVSGTTVAGVGFSASPLPITNSSNVTCGGSIELKNIKSTVATGIHGNFNTASSVVTRLGAFNYSTAGALTAMSLTPSAGTITSMLYSVKALRA